LPRDVAAIVVAGGQGLRVGGGLDLLLLAHLGEGEVQQRGGAARGGGALDEETAQDLVLGAGEDGDLQVLDLVGRVGGDLARRLAAHSRDLQGLDRAPTPSRSYADEQSNPGTGWGNAQRDEVTRTHFLAEATPVDHVVLRYEYANGLRALGIRIWNGRDRTWERERGQLGFAQSPDW